jgi:transposase
MAGKTISMSKLKQIIRLRGDGVALQAIAKAVDISRNTVKKYLRLIEIREVSAEALLQLPDEALEAMLADPDGGDEQRLAALSALFPYMEKELRRTGVTRWILWGEYKQKHPDGFSYSRFCDHFKQYRVSQSGSLRFEYKPGDKLFIDFTGKKLAVVDPTTAEVNEVEVYVAILGYSQLTYVQAVSSQRKEDFIAATENALHFFGGVPQVLIPDNLKSAVTRADKYEAEINAAFLDFANHYGTAVMPARSYKPQDKAHVERAVNIAYSRIFAPLRNRVFHTLRELNEAIGELLIIHNDTHFRQRPISRRTLFEQEEKQLLGRLPADRYEIKQSKDVTVMKNGYIQLRKHYYSVPYRFIGRKVKVIWSASQVSVFYNRERIAYHRYSSKLFSHSTIREHLASTHQFVSDWNPDKFTSWAASISPVVADYIHRILLAATYPEQAYRSCVGILSFEKKVGRQRFLHAIERATYYGAFNYTMIKKILQCGLDKVAFGDEATSPDPLPAHDNIRGPEAYQ